VKGKEGFMKKYVLVAAVTVLAAGMATVASANNTCQSSDAFCVDTNDGAAGSGNPLVDVSSQGPWQGTIAASPGDDPSTQGYAFLDGDSTNQDPLDGYLGIHAADGGPVFADNGDFRRAGGNVLSPPAGGGLPVPGDLPALGLPTSGYLPPTVTNLLP
jgi:hypothetical protein